jgi:hypothetical protein
MMMGAEYSAKKTLHHGLPRLVGPAIAIVMWALFVPLAAQDIIENPDKPLAKDAGRILELRDEWVITDESGDFYFKGPYDLKVADDGSVFVVDEKQFLKFSPDGRFLKNLYKGGQGPGEIASWFAYRIEGSDLYILDGQSARFWRTDLDGEFKADIKLENGGYRNFLGALPEGFLFSKASHPAIEKLTAKLVEVPTTVCLINRAGKHVRDLYTFRPRSFYASRTAAGATVMSSMSWDRLIMAADSERGLLYAYPGQDYLIEVRDLDQGRIISRFRRPYPKVAYVEDARQAEFRKNNGIPKRDFEPDVYDLFLDGPRLWVRTSTRVKGKGALYDVLDAEGRWLDSFYLGAGRTLMTVRDGFVYTLEARDDGTFRIHKSRIVR